MLFRHQFNSHRKNVIRHTVLRIGYTKKYFFCFVIVLCYFMTGLLINVVSTNSNTTVTATSAATSVAPSSTTTITATNCKIFFYHFF